MTKYIYEIHEIITERSGPFTIEADTWIEARVAVMKQMKKKSTKNLTIKLVCKNPFEGTPAAPNQDI